MAYIPDSLELASYAQTLQRRFAAEPVTHSRELVHSSRGHNHGLHQRRLRVAPNGHVWVA